MSGYTTAAKLTEEREKERKKERKKKNSLRLTNKVSVLEIEPIQLVTGLLCIHHVLIDNKCGSLGVVRDSLADLAVKDGILVSYHL